MYLIGKPKLVKIKVRNGGNKKLVKAIDKFISDLEEMKVYSSHELKERRPDADKVHSDGFYFFNLDTYRTLVLVVFNEQEAEIIWVNDHKAYDRIFQNSKDVIEKWLRKKGLIE